MLINQPTNLAISVLLCLIAIVLSLPIIILFIECSVALLPNRFREIAQTQRPSIAVLVPAHNEAPVIKVTLETLRSQLIQKDQLIVIADNCSDETTAIARSCGATVIERQDSQRRGKGYALDYGLRYLESAPPEVVVVVDADCIVHQGAIDQIARLAKASTRPVQARYLMEQPVKPQPKDSVSALAFMVKNLVRPSGLQRLGLPCLLTGTGMAFPWSIIREASLANGNIVEDMQLSLEMAIAGSAPIFCSEAQVTGILPQQEQAATSQRTRWEHGHLQTLLTQVPRLLKASVSQGRFELFMIALDLCIPPLTLLVMLWGLALLGALLTGILGGGWLAGILLAIEGVLILISIFGAWVKFGRDDIPGLSLLSIPFYILWKIPLYLTFLVRPQTQWVRTQRELVDVQS